MLARRTFYRFATMLTALALAVIGTSCGDDGHGHSASPTQYAFSTTRLCALVPARDPAAAAFPPQPPVRVFGTDLGWTYERDGVITILFGDSWQRIDICPLQPNDDTLGILAMPPDDWPGFEATQSLPDDQCPTITYPVDQAGTSFAPIELNRWDGVPVPLGPLNTPVTGFFDGQREWAVFLVGGGQSCTSEDSIAGVPCPSSLSRQASDLTCGFVDVQPQCLDPTSTKSAPGNQAYYLHFAERVGPSQYITRAMFLTNKYLNLTARTVTEFDESGRHDYSPGPGALLMWGRPGFNDQERDGEAPPFFMYHRLPLTVVDGLLEFAPRYLTGLQDGNPTFGDNQRAAVPLYNNEFEPVNHAAVSWIAPLRRWLMIYGGSVVDLDDPNNIAGLSQPVRRAMYARTAADPWGPWTDAEPVLTQEQVAEDLACGRQQFAGCLPEPSPRIRPGCIEFIEPNAGGHLYGANIIDSYTRARGREADVFWVISTWHPYSVVLVKTRVAPE